MTVLKLQDKITYNVIPLSGKLFNNTIESYLRIISYKF